MRLPQPNRVVSASLRRALAITLGLVAGCFTSSDGLEPPLDRLYFPTALVVSPGKQSLFVTSSDFDLAYNGGTVHALDLALIRGRALPILEKLREGVGAAAACEASGLSVNDDPLLHPGPCAGMPLDWFQRRVQIVGAFASGATLVSRSDGPGARLFVTVRGDPSVTYFDVSDDRDEVSGTDDAYPCADPNPSDGIAARICLECGASGDGARCGSSFAVGTNAADSQRGLTLPAEPFGIASAPSSSGDALVVANQTAAAASLVVNHFDDKPRLEYYVQSLANGPTEVAAVPVPKLVAALRSGSSTFGYQPGFLLTYRNAGQVDLLRYNDDAGGLPPRPFITRAASVGIVVNSIGSDSRGLVVDATERQACESGCASSDAICLRNCVDIPVDFYIANRSPASLLVGRLETQIVESADENGVVRPTSAFELMNVYDTVALSFGASKVAMGTVIEPDGSLGRRIFAVAFDSRFVFSYDPKQRRIDAVIRTGRGPHSIAFDSGSDGNDAYALLYVGHFTDSYVGVVDLDMRHPETFGSMIASVGVPTPPRESQ